jgi:hypothetical protein
VKEGKRFFFLQEKEDPRLCLLTARPSKRCWNPATGLG